MTTWAQLQADFPAWAKRTDLAARLPGFVALAESRFNRRLRVRQQEESFSGTIDANGELALPASLLAVKTIWVPGYEGAPLKPQSLDFVKARQRLEQRATTYALGAASLTFDGSGQVEGVYFKPVPGLVDNGSTWLSALAYEAYLFGALAEAALDERDPERALSHYGRADAAIAEVISNDQRDRFSGPLISRKR